MASKNIKITENEVGTFKNQRTGEMYIVLKYTKEILHSPLSGNEQYVPSPPSYKTSCGITLNFISKDDETQFKTPDGDLLIKVN